MSLISIASTTILLFLVLDPIGNIPLFLIALKNVNKEKHSRIILRELLIGLFFLITFFFLGRYILTLLNISQSSLSIAGGIILFLIAIKMIFSGAEDIFSISIEGEPFIVPLAIPLIAGPSALAMVLLLMAREPQRWKEWLIAIVCAWLLTSTILLLSQHLTRILKKRGLTALERLMGMILTTVSVEMFIRGLKEIL